MVATDLVVLAAVRAGADSAVVAGRAVVGQSEAQEAAAEVVVAAMEG